MPLFEVEVIEKRTYLVVYRVAADDAEEARERAEEGDTESEVEIKPLDVVDRQVRHEPRPVEDKEDVEI